MLLADPCACACAGDAGAGLDAAVVLVAGLAGEDDLSVSSSSALGGSG